MRAFTLIFVCFTASLAAAIVPAAVEAPPATAIVPVSEAVVAPSPRKGLPVPATSITPTAAKVLPTSTLTLGSAAAAPSLVASAVSNTTYLAHVATAHVASHLSEIKSFTTLIPSTAYPLSTSHWDSNATMTTATLASSHTPTAPTETHYPGGLVDPTLDKPCYNSSCANPDSNMNFVVTLNVDKPKEEDFEDAATTTRSAEMGLCIGALAVAVGFATMLF